MCCSRDLTSTGFIFAFAVQPSYYNYTSVYDGEHMENFHSLIIRCKVDSVTRQIECDKVHSILLKKEYTHAVLEYATG